MTKKIKNYLKVISIILTFAIILQSIPIAASAQSILDVLTETQPETTVDEEATIVEEDISLREENKKYFLMSDKTYLIAMYNTPVHYLENGQWVDIDNSLSEDSDSEGDTVFKNKKSAFEIKFSKKAKKNKLVSIKKDGYKLDWSLENAKKVNAIAFSADGTENDKTQLKNINGTVVYEDVLNNTDLKYLVTPTSIKEYLSLKNAYAPSSYTFAYNLNNLSWRENDSGDIELYDETNPETNVYVIEKAYMYDSAGEYSDNITMDVSSENDSLIITLTPDKEWLNAEEREFPVIIDPTVRTQQDISSVQTTYYTQNSYDLSAYGTLYAGYEKDKKGKVSSALKFQLPTLSSTDIVLKAVVGLYQTSYSYAGYTSNPINVYKITSSWTSPSSPGVHGNPPAYDTKVLDYAAVGTATTNQFVTWDITSAAKGWYTTPSTNYGILIKAADETKWAIARFSDTLNGNLSSSARPILILQYMDSKGINPYQDYTQITSIYKSSFAVNNYTGNLVYSYNDISMPGTRSGISITHYYNSADYNDADVVSRDFASSANGQKVYYGIGFRTNLNQQLSDKTISGKNYKVHTDADGTKHYFEATSDSNPTRWEYEFDKQTFITQNENQDYCIQYEDGSKLVFSNTSRRLLKIVDSSNNTLTLEYANESYYPTAVIDDLNQRTELTYTNNYLTSITDTAGRTTSFTYHSDGRLSTITDSQSGVTQFNYSGGYLTSVTSPEAQKMVFEYESATPEIGFKKITKATEYSGSNEGNYLQFSYEDGKTTVTDRQGASVTSVFDFVGRAVTKYDRDMNVVSTKYMDGSSTTDSFGITSKKVDTRVSKQFSEKYVDNLLPNGSAEIDGYWGQSNWGTGTYSFSTGYATDYASSGYRSQKVQVNAPTDTYLGRVYILYNLKPGVTYTYSAYVKTENVSDHAGALLYASFSNSSGVNVGYANSQETTGTNDWKRISVTFTVPDGAVQMRFHCGIRLSSGTAWFDQLQLEEGAVANRYNYVDNGSFENYSGSMPSSWTKGTTFTGGTVTINDRGVRNGKGVSITGTSETLNAYYKQVANVTLKKGQLITFSCWAKADSVPTTGNRDFSIDIGYNYVDNGVSGREYLRFDFDPECNDWQYLKDSIVAKGDATQIDIIILYRDNANTAYFDDFQLFIGEDGQKYEYYTSADGAGLDGKLKYSYDGTKKTSYTYGDTAKNLTKITYPDNTTEEYTYDSNKRIVSAKDRSGVVYNYTYDSYGNALTMTVGTAPNQLKVTNEYVNGNMLSKTTDSNGGVTTYDYHQQKGTLQSVTDSNGVRTDYTYDNYDRILSVTSGGATVQYTYDTYNLKSITAGNGTVYTFNYDTFYDDVSNIKVGGKTLIEHEYAAYNGRLTRSDYGNGAYTENVYESEWDNSVIGIKYNGSQLYSYSYDSSGKVGTQTDSENGVKYRYEYDEIGRMTGE